MFMGLGSNWEFCMEIDKMVITTVEEVKLLAVIIDSKLKSDKHVNSLIYALLIHQHMSCRPTAIKTGIFIEISH